MRRDLLAFAIAVILLMLLLALPAFPAGPAWCPPGVDCETGCSIGVGIGVGVNRWQDIARRPLVPVVRNSFVVPVLVGTDPISAAGVYVGPIRGRGVVLTCFHVAALGVRSVAGVRPIEWHRDKYGYDLAALIVPPLDVPVVTLGKSLESGAPVEVIGYPLGRFGRQRGRITGRFLPMGGQSLGSLKIDVVSQDGNSGGAVLDGNGALVGILWGTWDDDGSQGSAAVPVEAIADFLQRLEIVLSGETGPVESVEPVIPAPLTTPEPATDCNDLRALIQQNAEAIAALAAVARLPGEQGERGEPGLPGESPAIDYDTLVEEVIKRLPPVRLQTVMANPADSSALRERIRNAKPGDIINEATAPLGKPLKLRLVPVSSE